jgi:hypothetical protein
MGFLDSVISNLGNSLEQSVTTYANGQIDSAVGGTMGYLFGGDQKAGGDTLGGLPDALNRVFDQGSAQLTTLLSDVTQQQQEITAIGNQLQAVSGMIQQITGEIANIEAMLSKINQQQLYATWKETNDQIKVYVNVVDTTYQTYADYMQAAIGKPTTEISRLADDITSPTTGVKTAANGIGKFLLSGGDQDKGALQLWSEMVTPLVTQGVLDYREAVAEYMDYYSKLAYSQLRATNLLIEANHFYDDAKQAGSEWEEYKKLVLSQEDQFIQYLVPLVVAAIPGPWVDLPGQQFSMENFTAVEAPMQLHPGLQTLPSDADSGSGYYAPTSIFRDAEKMLASLYVTGPEQRRIVVHMLYRGGPNGTIASAVNGVPLTIAPATGGSISPTHQAQFGPLLTINAGLADKDAVPADPNFRVDVYSGSVFYLNRLVYEDVLDGTYNLYDLNNTLPPIDSMVGKTPFQQKKVLGYTLQVNAATPFDFMNFGGYMYSVLYPYNIAAWLVSAQIGIFPPDSHGH